MLMKRCPFCGGEADLYYSYSPKYRKYFVYVKCEICRSQGKTFASAENPADYDWNTDTCEKAVKAWNMRYSNKQRRTRQEAGDQVSRYGRKQINQRG